MLKHYKKELWVDLETYELITFREMIDRIENNYDTYGIDDFTPESEVFEFFMPESLFVD